MKIKYDLPLNRIHPVLWQAICIITSVSVFCALLINRKIELLHQIGFALRVDFLPIIPLTGLVLYLAFKVHGKLGELFTMMLTMSLFALPLVGLWDSGHTHTTALSGLIPLGDAKIYYSDALRLTSGLDFSSFSARRPLFSGLLAFLLWATNYNLMTSLAIFTWINGFASYLTAKEIQRTHGAEVSTIMLLMVFLFFRLHSGTAMTENLGMALGLLGFILLWRGASVRKQWLIFAGLFVSTLALNARAGAFFVLPFIVVWAGWVFRENELISWKAISMSALAVTIAFAANLIFTQLTSEPAGVPFANFSYSLYGLASGGKSWFYIYEVHPELFKIPEPEHSKLVYQLAFKLIQENPIQTVKGAIFNWKMLFSGNLYSLYSYVAHENWNINPVVKWGLYFISIMGLLGCIRKMDNPINSLVIACILGIFFSIPFAPPIDTFRLRQFAASIGMLTVLPALGVGYLLQFTKIKTFFHDQFENPSATPMIFTILMISISLIAPILIRYSSSEKNFNLVSCPAKQVPIVVRIDQGTYVNVREQNGDFTDGMPDFHVNLFRREAHSLSDENMINWLQKVPPSNTLLMTLDRIHKSGVLLVLPTNLMPSTGQFVQLCGNYEEDPGLEFFKAIFYAKKLVLVY